MQRVRGQETFIKWLDNVNASNSQRNKSTQAQKIYGKIQIKKELSQFYFL